MRVPRIHHAGDLVAGDEVVLDKAASRHLGGVLRTRAGDPVHLFNGDGHDYRAELVESGRVARLRVLSRAPNRRESPLAVTLVQGISRGERMDASVRQSVELGVARIVPVLTRRAQVSLDAARAAKRHAHWQSIVISACEQCGRSRLPALDPLRPLDIWLASFDANATSGIVLAPSASHTLADIPAGSSSITLLVGPESGLDPAEIAAATDAGLRATRFGPRVLRTETAGPAALAALQVRHGDMLS